MRPFLKATFGLVWAVKRIERQQRKKIFNDENKSRFKLMVVDLFQSRFVFGCSFRKYKLFSTIYFISLSNNILLSNKTC